jgi:TonB-linked SusC/RagA family outer membrane protein
MTKKITLVFSSQAFFNKFKMVMKILTMLLLFGTIQTFASASMSDDGIVSSDDLQQTRVTGKITDSDGNALPGVNIIEKGTLNGAITDANGNYAITVASPNAILSYSFIGYLTQEITVGTQTAIDITMHSTLTGLDEIVVVGYSTQARKSLTGAVSTVNAADLAESASVNPMQRLQGKVAGVSILNQHTPGEGATIRIRGMTTINDSNPLYVVDGVPGGTYAPNDVESITILKDAAAQSIYGARAANGVVLVTTKGGTKNQKVTLNVNVRQGITKNSRYYDLLNTQEWGQMVWVQTFNDWQSAHNDWVAAGDPTKPEPVLQYNHPQYGTGSTPVIPDYIFPTAAPEGDPRTDPALYDNKTAVEDGDDSYLITRTNKAGTDWMKESQRNAAFKEYTIDIAGGSANTTYAFLLGYTKDDGVFKWTGFDRYSGRANINSSPAKWIDLGTNIGLNFTKDYGYQGDNSESSIVSWCYRLPPMIPVFDISGTTYAGSRASGMGNAQNPVFLLDKNQYDYTKRMNVSGTAYLKLNLLKGLSVKTLIGVNHYGSFNQNINFVEVAAAERGTYDYLSNSASFGLDWTWTNTIEYSLIVGQHNIKAIAGSEAYDNNYNTFAAERSEFSFKDVDYMTLNTGLQGIGNSGSRSAYSLFSLFGRVNYSYADKYLLEGVIRRDGSSRFGTEKYGIFPAFSLGWRITQEDFMASTSTWLDELKLRFGYGAVGNDRMGNYNSYTNFALSFNNSFYPINGSNAGPGATGFYQTTFGNPDVKWETTTTTNIGIDATVIKNLTLNLDIWQRSTKDMLYPKQIPLILGTASTPSVNIGEMKNTGFDIQLGYSNSAMNGDFTYSIDLVFSHYKNELVKLTDNAGDFYQGSNYREKPYTRSQTGTAFPEFYGYIVEGIFQSQAEADEWYPAFGENGTYNKAGHFKYKDVDGNGYIDSNDRTFIGSPHPDFTAGLSFNVAYKGISLSTTLYASVGNEVVNYVSRFIDYTQFASGKSHRRLYESWGSPYLDDNLNATMPIIYSNDTQHQEPSTAFIEDGSFLRMKTLRIGYDLNSILKNRAKTLQLYFQASNPFTITKYSGLDPEIAGAGINMGIDSGAWPTPKQFIFGIAFGI